MFNLTLICKRKLRNVYKFKQFFVNVQKYRCMDKFSVHFFAKPPFSKELHDDLLDEILSCVTLILWNHVTMVCLPPTRR